MIKSHPTPELLRAFTAGELPSSLALAISAHVDMCRLCQRDVNALEQHAARALEEYKEHIPAMDAGLEAMLAGILDTERNIEEPSHSYPQHLKWNGQKFRLPRALQRQAAEAGKWSQLGRLWRSRLLQDESWRTSFLYIEKGGQIPQHTHKGLEATLVLSGRFKDDNETYHEGDFILRDGRHTHTPGADQDQDCLCFAAVEAPLHFTSGAARLLNPLGKLLY